MLVLPVLCGFQYTRLFPSRLRRPLLFKFDSDVLGDTGKSGAASSAVAGAVAGVVVVVDVDVDEDMGAMRPSAWPFLVTSSADSSATIRLRRPGRCAVTVMSNASVINKPTPRPIARREKIASSVERVSSVGGWDMAYRTGAR